MAAVDSIALLSLFTCIVLDKLFSKAVEELGLHCGVEKELDRVQSQLNVIKPVLEDIAFGRRSTDFGGVEKELNRMQYQLKPIVEDTAFNRRRSTDVGDGPLRRLLWDLADVVYELDDALDELEWEAQQSSSEVHGSSFSTFSYHFLFGNQVSRKFKTMVKKLDAIVGEMRPLGLLEMGGKGRGPMINPKPRSSFYHESFSDTAWSINKMVGLLLGRSSQPSHPHDNFLSDPTTRQFNGILGSKNISVVVVEGCEGFGKTRLIEQVYREERVRKHFNLRIWVSVSTGPAGSSILDSIVEDVNELDSCGVSVKLRDLRFLEENFDELLAGRRFLLVLDDVQHEHLNGWDDLCRNLTVGEDGSKVVVTSRSFDLAKMIGALQTCALGGLSCEDSWLFFKIRAFGDQELDGGQELEGVGRQIARLLGGSPGAIQIIASVLSHQSDVDFWRNILKSCEALRSENDSISVVLKTIYQYLSPHLKLCLFYFSLYPRGHKFEKMNLIHYWVAGGFILPREGKSIEDLAAQYFDDLSSMSFFRLSKDRYMLHDSVHEIASQMFVFPCLGTNWLTRIPEKVVHLSLISDNIQLSEFEALCKFKNLRSLVFMPRYNSRLDHLTEELLPMMKSLRMLELSHTGIKELPVSIGELKHLRFLNLSHTRIESLPESLANLRKLQILDLSGCIMLYSLPTWINKVSSLRHLKARPDLICTIEGIGKLSSLQNLEEFRVYKKDGHKIAELENMRELHGKLRIRNIENIKSAEEARGANLYSKVYLEGLELEWSDDRHDKLIDMSLDDKEILEGLRSPSNLKMISIEGFNGSKSPSWMHGLLSFSRLESLSLKNCRKWEVLPPLGDAPNLEFLELCGMERVMAVDNRTYGSRRFASLVELRLHGLSRWGEWLGVDDDLFPKLRVLEIKDCPMLRTMPPLPPALRELRIERVGLLTLADTVRYRDNDRESIYSVKLFSPPPLSSIYISDCPSLTSVRIGYFNRSTALEVLTIRRCGSLASFPTGWFHNLPCLKSLIVEDCPNLFFSNSSPMSGQDNPSEKKWSKIIMPNVLLDISIVFTADSIKCQVCNWLPAKDAPSAKLAAALPSSIKTLKIVGSPGIVKRPLFAELQTRKSLSFTVAKEYTDLASCKEEALRHLTALQSMTISYCRDLPSSARPILLEYRMSPGASSKAIIAMRGQPPDLSAHSPAQIIGRNLQTLKHLELTNCPDINSFPGEQLDHLTALEDLTISSCRRLQSVQIQSFTGTLKRLAIRNCPKLTSFTITEKNQEDQATSLQSLVLHGCSNLSFLPTNMQILESLEALHIENCPQLRCLPDAGLPISLRELVILQSPLLTSRCRSESGQDWHKIAFVPDINLDC